MSCLTLPLVEEYELITRRVTLQVVKKLILLLDFNEDIQVLYRGNSTTAVKWNSETKLFKNIKLHEVQDDINFGQGEKLIIEVKEDVSDEGYNRNRLFGENIPPIWVLDDYTYLMVHYLNTNLEISFTYQSTSLEKTNRFKTRLALILGAEKWTIPLDISYYILPHMANYEVLEHIYDLRYRDDKYRVAHHTWLEKHAISNSLRQMSKLNGEKPYYGFKERQSDLYGLFNFTELPDASKRDKGPGHELNFEVKLQYEKPMSTSLFYPICINNHLIDEQYIIAPEVDRDIREPHKTYSYMMEAAKAIFSIYGHGKYSYSAEQGITVPLGDSWLVPKGWQNYKIFFTGLVKVQDPINGQSILGKVSDWSPYVYLSQAFLDYLSVHGVDCFLPNRGLVLLNGWCNDKQIGYDDIQIDKDLLVTTRHQLNKLDLNHITMHTAYRFHQHPHVFFEQVAKFPALVEELYHTHVAFGYRSTIRELVAYVRARYVAYRDDPEKIGKLVSQHLFRPYPYIKKGDWHLMVLYLLFDQRLPKRLDGFYELFLVEHADGLSRLPSRDDQLDYLYRHRYDIWYSYAKYHKHETLDTYRQQELKSQFFGAIDVIQMKAALLAGTINPETGITYDEDQHSARHPFRPYVQEAYITAQRPD